MFPSNSISSSSTQVDSISINRYTTRNKRKISLLSNNRVTKKFKSLYGDLVESLKDNNEKYRQLLDEYLTSYVSPSKVFGIIRNCMFYYPEALKNILSEGHAFRKYSFECLKEADFKKYYNVCYFDTRFKKMSLDDNLTQYFIILAEFLMDIEGYHHDFAVICTDKLNKFIKYNIAAGDFIKLFKSLDSYFNKGMQIHLYESDHDVHKFRFNNFLVNISAKILYYQFANPSKGMCECICCVCENIGDNHELRDILVEKKLIENTMNYKFVIEH